MPKSKADADRTLYEYQRQLKAPKVLADKYPNIAKAIDPYILSRPDNANYNKLGQNTPQIDNSAFGWYRDNEEKASQALAKDIYNTEDPYELAKKIAEQKGLDYKIQALNSEIAKQQKLSGVYDPDKHTLFYNEADSLPAKLDTIIHESGHAKDYKESMPTAKNLPATEQIDYPGIEKDFKNKDLYKLSDNLTRNHFLDPRSHSINELLNQTKSVMGKQGIYPEPDDNIVYDSLNYIKPTVKQLEGYAPPEDSLFAKTKAFFKK